jgi:hypothetical protein
MKTEVYSWRVSTDLKTELEREAQRRKLSLAAVLDLAARDWLSKGSGEAGDDEEQLRLQKAALKCFGAFAGGEASRSDNVSQSVRKKLRRHYGR